MPFPARLSFEDAVRDGGAALRGALARHGYAHVTGVVGRAECAAWCDDLRRFIAALGFPGARFDDPASVADPARWPEGCAEGIFGGYGVGAWLVCGGGLAGSCRNVGWHPWDAAASARRCCCGRDASQHWQLARCGARAAAARSVGVRVARPPARLR